MRLKYFLTFLLSLYFVSLASGQTFRNPGKKKWGMPIELSSVFTEQGISTINHKVDSLNQKYNYDIAISLGHLPIKLNKRNPSVTQEMLVEFEEETFDNAYRNLKKLNVGKEKDDKGILIDVSFRTANDEDNQEATSYTYQHVAFGDEASLLMKVGIGSFKQDSKIALYSDEKGANETHVIQLVNKIGEYLEMEKIYGDSALAIGPLIIYYNSKSEKMKGAFEDDSYSYDKVELRNSTCALKFMDISIYEKTFELKNFNVNLYYDFKNNVLHSASITYNPSNPYAIGELGFIKTAIKDASLSVDKDGKLTGTVNMKASTTEHIDLAHMVRIRKGINGDFSFTFSGEDNFNGAFDLGGIKGINVDMMKGDKALASISNMTFKDGGVLSGKFVLKEDPEFPVGVATAEVKKLDLNVNYSLKEGLEVPKGVAQLKLKNIRGVTGSLVFDVNYHETSGMTCEMAQEGNTLSGFGCEFQNLEAVLNIDSEWNFRSLEGGFKAKHPDFDSQLNIKKFKINDGALTYLEAYDSKVGYMGFQFNLKNMVYKNDQLAFSANLLMKMNSNYYTDITVDKFTLDNEGDITIGNISGKVKYPAFAMKFNATYDETRFSGSMTSTIKQFGINIRGTFDVGTRTYNDFTYDYGYASLTLGSNTGLMIPGTPFNITQFGGLGGYNYKVQLKDPSNPMLGFEKGPEYKTYVAGIELGVTAKADLIKVVGKTIVLVGDDKFGLTLAGDVSIPSTNPYFKGNLLLNYTYENEQSYFAGKIGTEIKIPSSGSIFKTENMSLGFTAGPQQWRVFSDDSMSAKLFNIIEYRGFVDFQSGYEEDDQVTGSAYGRISAGFDVNFDEELNIVGLSVANAKGSLSADIWAEGSLLLQHDYFKLSSSVGFRAEGEIDAEFLGGIYDIHCKANTHAIGKLIVASDYVQASAKLSIHLEEYDSDGELEGTYDVSFDGCQRLGLSNFDFQDCPLSSY